MMPEEATCPLATGADHVATPSDARAVSAPSARAGYASRLLAPAGLVLLVFVVFMPALDAGLVNWDDEYILAENAHHHLLTIENLKWMFTTSFAGHFQPLAWLSYAVDYHLWGLETFGFHLTNVLCHVATALLFYLVVRRLFRQVTGRKAAEDATATVWAPAFSAALFACHPLRAESVAWLAERRDVLGGMFYLLSVYAYLRWAEATQDDGRWARRDRRYFRGGLAYLTAVVACLLSLLARAGAMTVPFVLLVLDVYPLRRHAGARGGSVRLGKLLAEKLPLLGLAAFGAARALVAQADSGAMVPLSQHDWVSRLAQACYGLSFYLWKTVWPAGLGPLYEIPSRDGLLNPMLWLPVGALVALGAFCVYGRRRLPGIAAGLVIYVIILLPVLGFAQSGPQLVADRYSYLACMPFAVWLGYGLILVGDRVRALRLRHGRSFLVLTATALVVVSGHATFAQADIWRSSLHLWRRGVKVSPNSAIAHVNFADALARAELYAQALVHYQRALQIDPNDVVALHHLGDLFQVTGHPEPAIKYYLHALSRDPNRRGAHVSLAKMFLKVERPNDALLVLRDGARRLNHPLDIVDMLAWILALSPDESVRNGEEAVQWATLASAARGHEHPPTLMVLAGALAEAGRFKEAARVTQRAIALTPVRGHEQFHEDAQRRLETFENGRAR